MGDWTALYQEGPPLKNAPTLSDIEAISHNDVLITGMLYLYRRGRCSLQEALVCMVMDMHKRHVNVMRVLEEMCRSQDPCHPAIRPENPERPGS